MFLEMNFHSRELGRQVRANVIIPEQVRDTNQSYKTLWLLHGLTDDHSAWMRYSSIERYANELGIAVVMPNVDRSWYTNTAYDANYFNFVAKELPEVCRGLFKGMSGEREDNMVGGLSMGGYGAVKLVLTCPELGIRHRNYGTDSVYTNALKSALVVKVVAQLVIGQNRKGAGGVLNSRIFLQHRALFGGVRYAPSLLCRKIRVRYIKHTHQGKKNAVIGQSDV